MSFLGRKIISRIKYNLSAQIFLSVVVSMTTLIVLFDFLIIRSQEKAVTSYVIAEGKALSQLLADTVTLGVYSENQAMIKQSVAPVLNQADVIGIEIFNGLGKLQFASIVAPERKIATLKENNNIDRLRAISIIKENQAPIHYERRDSLDFWAPVYVGTNSSEDDIYFRNSTLDQAIIGFVRIVISKQKLSIGIERLTGENLFALAVFLLLSTLVTFLVVRTVTFPLSQLVAKMRHQKTEGMSGANDVGFLNETYDEQLKSLERAFQEIQTLQDNREDTTRAIISAQEQEKKRISYDLHDHIAQELSALRMDWETFFDDSPEVPQDVLRKKDAISFKVRGCIHSVRDLSYGLRPPDLDALGLTQAFYQYCTEFSEENGLELHFQSAGIENLKLDNSVEINLYRILQEALNNIKSHAQAKNLTVKLLASHPDILLRIEDDGRGFDYSHDYLGKPLQKRHMGLQIMKERATLFHGGFDLRSCLGRGTKILVKIPS